MPCLPIKQLVLVALLSHPAVARVQELKSIQLPSPQTEIGRPLMQVLMVCRGSLVGEEIELLSLSNLLWAAFGINRPDGKRTASLLLPTARKSIFTLLLRMGFTSMTRRETSSMRSFERIYGPKLVYSVSLRTLL